MDLSVRTEAFGAGDQSWLGSAHGTNSARTVTIKRSSLVKATHYPDGRLKSGTPLVRGGDGLYTVYAGTGTLAGFLFTDQSVADSGGDIVAPLIDHGRIRLNRLPVTVAADATTSGQFVFVEGA